MIAPQEAEAVGVQHRRRQDLLKLTAGRARKLGIFNTEDQEPKCWRSGEVGAERDERLQEQP